MMLAEISNGESWMIVITAIMAVTSVVGTFWKKTEVQVQQPLDVTIVETLVSKADFNTFTQHNDQTHKELYSKIGGVERGANSSIDQKVEIVRKDVIEVGKQVAALKGQNEMQTQQLARMDAKLDRLAERHLK